MFAFFFGQGLRHPKSIDLTKKREVSGRRPNFWRRVSTPGLLGWGMGGDGAGLNEWSGETAESQKELCPVNALPLRER